jgi:hypothetical protein
MTERRFASGPVKILRFEYSAATCFASAAAPGRSANEESDNVSSEGLPTTSADIRARDCGARDAATMNAALGSVRIARSSTT